MKTTLSKSLLCGIIASTFLLANCQKAPSGRSVKAEVGNPGPGTQADKATVADKELNLVQCTPEFLKTYSDYNTLLTNVKTEVAKQDSSESHKANLLRFRKELEDKVGTTLEEMKKLKAAGKAKADYDNKIDGCYYDTTKKIVYTSKAIKSELGSLDIKIADITGVKSVRSEAALEAQKAAASEAKKQALGTTYKVSEEMNEIFGEPSASLSSTSKHFVDGKIAEKSEFEVNKKNVNAAVCEVTTSGGKLDADKLEVKALGDSSAKQEFKKTTFLVTLAQLANQGDKTYLLTCSLPANLKKEIGFAKAMGTFLVAQVTTDTTATTAADDDLSRIQARSESAQAMAADEAKKLEAATASKIETDAKAAAEQKAKDVAKADDEQKVKDEASAKAAADKTTADKTTADKATDTTNAEESGT